MARAVLVAAVEQLLIEALVARQTTAKYDVDVTNGSKEESILDRTSCNTQTPTAWKPCTTNILRLMLVETRHPPAPCRAAISRPPEHLPAREHSSPRAAQVPPPPPTHLDVSSCMDSRIASQSGRQHSMIRCGHSVRKSHRRHNAMVVCCPASVPSRLTCLSCHVLARESNSVLSDAEVGVLDENRSPRQLPCVGRLTTTTEDHEYKKS